jgi:photosystem II stability/assembly factor-like uncharacterized protein
MNTTDGGITWNNQTSGISTGLFDVIFLDSNTGTVVGANGIILRTFNGGIDWFQQAGPGQWLYSVDFSSADTGYAAGAGGTILYTEDGGQNWINQNTGTTDRFSGIAMSTSSNVTAVGIEGMIMQTTDGGNTWEPYVQRTDHHLWDVFFIDEDNGTIVGEGGRIFGTKPGGIVSVESNHTNELPKQFVLNQNYPNPFNPNTIIQFSISSTAFVTLEIFNVLGELIDVLVSEELIAGTYNYNWSALGLTSGIYLYRLKSDGYIKTNKMVLIR